MPIAPVVLVIEDELFLRLNIVSCLQEAGYAVVEAANGEEAIGLCHSDTSIDVVFTDVNLGGYASGWDVAEMFPHRPAGRAGGLYIRTIARCRAMCWWQHLPAETLS